MTTFAIWAILVVLVIGTIQLFYLGYLIQTGFNAICRNQALILDELTRQGDETRSGRRILEDRGDRHAGL